MKTERLLSVIGTLLLVIGTYATSCLKDLAVSVQELNVKMAVVISKQDNQESRITTLEHRAH